MANQMIANAMSAEQLMLGKMDAMRDMATPQFVVRPNPVDEPSLNQPLSFSAAMTSVLDRVNAHQSVASQMMTDVETGKSDDLVGAMIASQKASLSFNGLLQVRNQVVGAFDDIMKMPV
ncbi:MULTISPECIES: flagellar hook-basal body complex protein FliE [Vibrio]|uniref:Flagellar hook-basal body complex protein FliE n=1 Tax=Vibrio ostreae TaxID=2841925 RepID=A0A975YP75_9VIBR|nr:MULTISPECIES: flagellar hook-basal body complex protein FliE [Vibrio]QXO18301.1 flagellar hook-basal body complex protein FliE [Vibrio ostreae]